MRRVLQHRLGSFVLASGSEQRKVCSSREKFSSKEGRAERRKRKKAERLFRIRELSEPEKVASGSATQGLWIGNGKVRSLVNRRYRKTARNMKGRRECRGRRNKVGGSMVRASRNVAGRTAPGVKAA